MLKVLFAILGVVCIIGGISFTGYMAWTQLLIAGLMECFSGLQTQAPAEVGWGLIRVILAGPTFAFGVTISGALATICFSCAFKRRKNTNVARILHQRLKAYANAR